MRVGAALVWSLSRGEPDRVSGGGIFHEMLLLLYMIRAKVHWSGKFNFASVAPIKNCTAIARQNGGCMNPAGACKGKLLSEQSFR